MSAQTPHGAHGCPCEDCLGARIRLTAAMATYGRDSSVWRNRLDGFKALVPSPQPLRSVS
jgi:hypothetical protein